MVLTKKFITQIFLAEGFLIGMIGTSVGLVLGVSFVLLQQHFGLIGMDVQSAIVDAFPVKMEWSDAVFTGATTLTITLLLSIHPALKASNFDLEKL